MACITLLFGKCKNSKIVHAACLTYNDNTETLNNVIFK